MGSKSYFCETFFSPINNMNKTITWFKIAFILAVLGLGFMDSALAAAKDYKFGKVSVEELEQTVCPFDSAADAMYIYHSTSTYMTTQTDLILVTEYKSRIKVLTEEGKDEANIVITYYNNRSNGNPDRISNLSATVYNLEDGKVVATKMDKSYISEEQISDNYCTMKIALPNVKVGSVIEYRFNHSTHRYYQIPTWHAQRSLPVLQCHWDVSLPEYFEFNKSMAGGCEIHFKEELVNVSILGANVPAKRQIYDATNLAGVKNEKFVYGADNYVGSVNYELRSLIIPGHLYKHFSSTWDDVRQQVRGIDLFSTHMRASNPFKEEMSQLIVPEEKVLVKAQKLFNLLKEKVKWDETYAFSGNSPRSAVKDGKGSNAQLNFLLMAMMRDAGISCTPLMLKFRNNGPLPITHPTIDELNTFVVAFCDEEKNIFFLDGSADFGGVNVLPSKLLGEGILLDPAVVSGQIGSYRLSDLGGSAQIVTNQCIIEPAGKLRVSRRVQYRGMAAQDYRRSFHEAAGDTASFLADFEKNRGVEVNSFRFRERNMQENLSYTVECDLAGDELYVNALVTPEEHNNPFTAKTRQLPIMFPYLQTIKVTSIFVLPDNYEVVSLPEPMGIQTSDGNISAMLTCTDKGNGSIQTEYVFDVSTSLVPVVMYGELKEFWKKLIDMNNQTIVLKKK